MAAATMQNHFNRIQGLAHAKDAGHVGIAVAGAIMLFVACPMDVVIVAAPHWKSSRSIGGHSASIEASLWSVSSTVEVGSSTSDTSKNMCGDDMENSELSCGHIHAVRFFLVTALFLSLGAAASLLLAFVPVSNAMRERRPTLQIAGWCLACTVLMERFLSICLLASAGMPEPLSLSGAGFVFLVMSLFLVVGATVIILLVLRSEPVTPVIAMPAKQKTPTATDKKIPNLLVLPSSEKLAAHAPGQVDLEKEPSIRSTEGCDMHANNSTQEEA